ncbi:MULTISPECIES: DMT family transporter [unclassified Pseudomonas]|uniref:DMT family transporter n=1 Tax=unclassified Pseudomonas TaxID=196821 RepID=UPI001CBE16FD|nr:MULTISPECIES: DMT family transporter [unclassified Pseudomonas]
MTKSAGLKTLLVIMIAPLCWAGNFVLARHLEGAVSPIQLNFWRWALACITLTPFVGRQIPHIFHSIKGSWAVVLIQSATGIAIYHVLVYEALGVTTAINATLINSLVPMFIPLVAWIAYRRSIEMRQMVAIVLSTIGVAVVALKGSLDNLNWAAFNPGDLLMVLAAFVWASYTVSLTKKPRQLGGVNFLWLLALLGSLMMLPFYLYDVVLRGPFAGSKSNWVTVSYVAWFAGIVAFLAWNYGSTKLSPSHLGMFAHLIPVFGSLMAILLLGEQFHAYHGIGITLVAAGLYLAFQSSLSKQASTPKSECTKLGIN